MQWLDQVLAARPWNSAFRSNGASCVGSAKVLFSVRSNVVYNGHEDVEAPVFAGCMTIQPGTHIHVLEIKDDDWWYGRIVGSAAVLNMGLVPSVTGYERMMAKYPTNSSSKTVPQKVTRRPLLARPFPDRPVYDLVPLIQPMVFLGPAKHGYPVTDLMQEALVQYLRACFPTRCVSLQLRRMRPDTAVAVGPLPVQTGRAAPLMPGNAVDNEDVYTSPSAHELAFRLRVEVAQARYFCPADVARVMELAASGQMVLIRVDDEDFRLLKQDPLFPFITMIRPATIDVISRVIKAHAHPRDVDEQLAVAATLLAIDESCVDVMLLDSRVKHSCFQTAAFVDAYLNTTADD